MANTEYYKAVSHKDPDLKQILIDVYAAIEERGYVPIDQLVGYIVSEDPTYITSFNNARKKIQPFSQDEIIEFLLKEFFKTNKD